jgi:hypothetical protein
LGNLLPKDKLKRINNSWFQLKMVHSDCNDPKTVPEAITSLLSMKQEEYGSLNDGGFSFENMVEELDMMPTDLRAAVYELHSKSHLAKWVKDNFSGSTETENAEKGDDEEYIPEDDGQSNDSKKEKGKGKKSNKERDIVEKPFYFA